MSGITTDQRGQPVDYPFPDIGAFQTQTRRLTEQLLIVFSTNDDGSSGTLRWAVALANSSVKQNVIELEIGTAPATIVLSQGPIELSNPLGSIAIYDGPGQGPVTVSGNNASRVFEVDQGVVASLSGLTITGGYSSGSGAGLYSAGTTVLSDCVITGNTSTASASDSGGAGVFNSRTGNLTLDQCTVNANNAFRDGGGVFNAGTASLVNSVFTGNSSSFVGGGIFNDDNATGSVLDCTISGNSAPRGGGVFVSYPNSSITLTGTTISGNTATKGGGLYDQDHANLTDCTISGNSAQLGGGVENYGTVNLTACTVSGNSASQGGGGFYNYGTSYYASTASLIDTIVAGNTGSGGAADDISGDQASGVTGSFNLVGAGGAGGIVNGVDGDIVLTGLGRLELAPLGNYGGANQTMALLPG